VYVPATSGVIATLNVDEVADPAVELEVRVIVAEAAPLVHASPDATDWLAPEEAPVAISTYRPDVFVSVLEIDPVGADVIFAAATKVSAEDVATAACVTVIVVYDVTPTRAGPEVPAEIPVAVIAALAGATDVRTPRPKAATATSATRLKVVFVDICFLSISRSREFPPVGFG
jgi:hypothetical protein